MSKIKSACVYCGSSTTSNPVFDAPTLELGKSLAAAGITLVYGGGSPGLMGKVANSCLDAGGAVIGIIPDHILKLEVRHNQLTELHIVDNMHTRKMMMADKADAFVIMPGGLGTLDEAFEIMTWKYLGVHNKPIIIANIDGYWDPLIALIRHMNAHRFVREEHMNTYIEVKTVAEVMHVLNSTEKSTTPVQTQKI
ncbi:MAG TPA: TIGR00730 family Rossman fold protein [Rhodospirillaceae bacterium]|nr:TIGR00730 family Rossman fold protein [Rhodospirillaceae bacterium]